jgi:MAF protein
VSAKTVLLLASNSPRRRQLLSLGGWMFTVMVSDADESQRPSESPANYVLRLAESKARAVAQNAHSEHIVIGADTSVVDGTRILGKPADVVEAAQMLKSLRGHTHQVYTGIAALRVRDGKLVTDLCVTNVPMRDYSDAEIEAYILTGDPLDKAGAYAIQHSRFNPVEKMTGCYAGVMGLPLCHLVRVLRQLDVPPAADVPTNCQTHLEYQCPVSRAILRGEDVG